MLYMLGTLAIGTTLFNADEMSRKASATITAKAEMGSLPVKETLAGYSRLFGNARHAARHGDHAKGAGNISRVSGFKCGTDKGCLRFRRVQMFSGVKFCGLQGHYKSCARSLTRLMSRFCEPLSPPQSRITIIPSCSVKQIR